MFIELTFNKFLACLGFVTICRNGLEWDNVIQMMIISTTVGKNPLEEMELPFIVNKRVQNTELGYSL